MRGATREPVPSNPRSTGKSKRQRAAKGKDHRAVTVRPDVMAGACITLELRNTIRECDDWHDAVLSSFTGEIMVMDDSLEDVECGFIQGTKVDILACLTNGLDPFVVMDDESATLSYIGECILDMQDASPFGFIPWHPSALEVTSGRTDEPIGSKLLVVERLVVDAPFRGHLIGLRAMAMLMRQLADGCGFIAIKPFPLQYESGYRRQRTDGSPGPFDGFAGDADAATKKLHQHYAKLGFIDLPATELMVLNPEYVHPYQSIEFGLPA